MDNVSSRQPTRWQRVKAYPEIESCLCDRGYGNGNRLVPNLVQYTIWTHPLLIVAEGCDNIIPEGVPEPHLLLESVSGASRERSFLMSIIQLNNDSVKGNKNIGGAAWTGGSG